MRFLSPGACADFRVSRYAGRRNPSEGAPRFTCCSRPGKTLRRERSSSSAAPATPDLRSDLAISASDKRSSRARRSVSIALNDR